jgi:hypothetical protein
MKAIPEREIAKKINQLTRESPFYRKFNERRYNHLKGYIEHDDIMFSLARMMTAYQYYPRTLFDEDFTHKTSIITLDRAYREGFNSYWLGENLFDAFVNSHLPKTVGAIKQVIPCGVLVFPPKLRNPDGKPLKWLCFSHRVPSEPIPTIETLSTTLKIVQTADECLSWFTIMEDSTQYGVNRDMKLVNNQLDFHDDEVFINELLEIQGLNIDTTTEKEFVDRVTELLIQTLLYLQRPGSLEKLESRGQPHRGAKNKKEKLTPNIIGREYRAKSESGTGERGTKATHWRRGFYRWQPYGSRSEPEYKLLWIEPVLVNG